MGSTRNKRAIVPSLSFRTMSRTSTALRWLSLLSQAKRTQSRNYLSTTTLTPRTDWNCPLSFLWNNCEPWINAAWVTLSVTCPKSIYTVSITLWQSVSGLIESVPKKLILCLCSACADNFYDTSAYSLRRIDPQQTEKDTCTYCNQRKGFDYEVIPKRQWQNGSDFSYGKGKRSALAGIFRKKADFAVRELQDYGADELKALLRTLQEDNRTFDVSYN